LRTPIMPALLVLPQIEQPAGSLFPRAQRRFSRSRPERPYLNPC